MPKKFPPEFKRDVVTVARRGDLSVPEVAVDFGVSEESVRRWVRQADIDDGIKDGQTSTEQSELVALRRDKRRHHFVGMQLGRGHPFGEIRIGGYESVVLGQT